MLRGNVKARLIGGPFEGQDGEVVLTSGEPPATLPFHGGAFVYSLRVKRPKVAEYAYAPDLSSGHAGLVRADAEAVAEVARQRGLTVPALLAEVREARKAAASGEAPADVLFAEAARRGVSVEVLLAEHDESIRNHAEGVHL